MRYLARNRYKLAFDKNDKKSSYSMIFHKKLDLLADEIITVIKKYKNEFVERTELTMSLGNNTNKKVA